MISCLRKFRTLLRHFDHRKKNQNRCHQARFLGSKLSKCDRGSALDPAGEAYSAPIDLLAEFWGREEERERQGQGGWTEGERGNYPSQKISVLDPPVLLDLTGGESPRYYHRAHRASGYPKLKRVATVLSSVQKLVGARSVVSQADLALQQSVT